MICSMRASTKTWLNFGCFFCTYLYIIFTLWKYPPFIESDTEESDHNKHIREVTMQQQSKCTANHLQCIIEHDKHIDCVKYKDEVYFPFSFMTKRFEVYGKFVDNNKSFAMESSYGRVSDSVPTYSPTGSHADDLTAFVEGRPLIIQVDGIKGVPICSQWFPDGYFFSTDIAQYGLSHYSKYQYDKNPKTLKVVDKERVNCDIKKQSDSVFSPDSPSHSTHFKTSSSFTSAGIQITFNKAQNDVITKDILTSARIDGRLNPDSSITFEIFRPADKKTYHLTYVTNHTRLYAYAQTVIFGIGESMSQSMSRLSRNLYVDLEHGIFNRDGLEEQRIVGRPRNNLQIKVNSIILRGEGNINELTLANNLHLDHFYDAAKWMLENQDKNGGWPMPVSHTLGTYTMKPGWYTALGQGVGMSILCRAFHMTKNDTYLKACSKASQVFHKPSSEGGVRAVFMEKYIWYEEYPTQPPSFVLNGFMTALLGLYDLSVIGKDPDAKKLFDDGMNSLRTLVPMFDTGSGSLYDLKHITMLVDPNRCRPDYHNVHIELLMSFATIDNASVFKIVTERWKKYKTGWMSSHN